MKINSINNQYVLITSVACCLHSHSWPSFSKKRRKRSRSFTCCTWL